MKPSWRRSLINLVYNAIKFNEKGGTIKVISLVSADDKYAAVIVADTGVGIKEEEMSHIFERFYQGSTNSTNDKAKLGLACH